MSERKQRVFIGSSSETKELAKQIKQQIELYGSATAWWDDFFPLGDYVFNNLIQKAVSFDYAILLGGPDDRVIRLSNMTEKLSPRDNVYLEYGMFSGILSPNRILFLMHEDCRVASDLTGMMLAQYRSDEDAVAAAMNWLEKQLEGKRENRFTASDIELLPTVGIAVGYFHNFINRLYDAGLEMLETFEFDGREYEIDNVRMIISIPDYLEKDIARYKNALIKGNKLKKAALNGFRILIEPRVLEHGELVIHDVPDTLLAVYKTIDFIFGISDIDSEDSRFAKLRALDNFSDNVARLVAPHSSLAEIVEVRRISEKAKG